jgi:hypothetical protein
MFRIVAFAGGGSGRVKMVGCRPLMPAFPLVRVSPLHSLVWGPPPDPGTVALSPFFRLVCFGGSWWTAVGGRDGWEEERGWT